MINIILVTFALIFIALASIISAFTPIILQIGGRTLGWRLRKRTKARRDLLVARVRQERDVFEDGGKSAAATLDEEWEEVERNGGGSGSAQRSPGVEGQREWEGIIGFFHPFWVVTGCLVRPGTYSWVGTFGSTFNAGGGGERVLWEAIKTTQQTWPNATCVVYTGDHEVSKERMLDLVWERFNIKLYPPTVMFLYVTTRSWVLPSTWAHFTLFGQSVGSLILGYDAFSLLVPDIFIDTMGYAFTLAFCKLLFPDVPTGAYVHYPTISTDMLTSLEAPQGSGKGVHAGSGRGLKGIVKRWYWGKFAQLYSFVGGHTDVVMTNSSWTQRHIKQLWGKARTDLRRKHNAEVLFPPCPVEQLEKEIEVNEETEEEREPTLLYVAQFRPEKNHQLVLKAFAQSFGPKSPQPDHRSPMRATHSQQFQTPHLILAGSVRDRTDETAIYSLRLLAHELRITDNVTFLLNAPWPTIMSHLKTASVGVNAMWNEHFGIGVVEYQAAGLISVVNDSGGPKQDIVIPTKGGPTGYHASTEREYALAFGNALSLDKEEALAMRLRARESAKRFNVQSFNTGWIKHVERLIALRVEADSAPYVEDET